jgi:hypothetical protein
VNLTTPLLTGFVVCLGAGLFMLSAIPAAGILLLIAAAALAVALYCNWNLNENGSERN